MKRTYNAPAKVNLWLRVFRPDATGYHPLDTLFCAIDLQDEIEIEGGRGVELNVTGADLGPPETNLAYRAALEYCHTIGVPANVHIKLSKRIPSGAGLGGGSSDAAAVLRAMQERHGARLPQADLLALAARLGSDVPFFLCGSSFAHATGRGEVLTALPPLPQRHVIVVMPSFSIATRDAYGWLDAGRALELPATPSAHPRDWNDVARAAVNDFETVLFERYRELADLTETLKTAGAQIALLSGSGSAVFGVFESGAAAEAGRSAVAARFGDVAIHSARTLM